MAKLDVVIPAVEVEVNGVKYRKVDREAKAGDIVRAKRNEFDIDAGAYYQVFNVDGEIGFYDDADDFRISPLKDESEDYEVYEKVTEQPKPARLKIGDYAKVIADNYEHRVGHIIQVTDYTNGTFDYEVKRITLGGTGYIAHKNIVCATEADVEAAKEEAARKAEEKKWAKIGRKVNEYKRGDIVQYRDGSEVVVVTSATERTVTVETAEFGICTEDFHTVKLIVPVEQRFDMQKEAA